MRFKKFHVEKILPLVVWAPVFCNNMEVYEGVTKARTHMYVYRYIYIDTYIYIYGTPPIDLPFWLLLSAEVRASTCCCHARARFPGFKRVIGIFTSPRARLKN